MAHTHTQQATSSVEGVNTGVICLDREYYIRLYMVYTIWQRIEVLMYL